MQASETRSQWCCGFFVSFNHVPRKRFLTTMLTSSEEAFLTIAYIAIAYPLALFKLPDDYNLDNILVARL